MCSTAYQHTPCGCLGAVFVSSVWVRNKPARAVNGGIGFCVGAARNPSRAAPPLRNSRVRVGPSEKNLTQPRSGLTLSS